MKRAKSFLTALLVAAAFVACDKDPVGQPTPPVTPPVTPPAQPQIPITGVAVAGFESVDLSIPDLMKQYSIPGGAVAVMRDGKLIYARGFGYADVENKTPVQPDALFRIASVSKPITSAAIMTLVEEGKLKLDDRVAPFIAHLTPAPGATVDARWEQITIRHMLTHTGGWDRTIPVTGFDPMDRPLIAAAAVGAPAPASAETLIRYMKGMPFDFNPGEKFAYSNLGYAILGRVIENVTGMSYAEYARTRVLQPVGANRTQQGRTRLSHALPEEVKYYLPGLGLMGPMVASVFPGEPPAPLPYGAFHIESFSSSGAWVSSTIDLLRFLGGVDGRADRPDILIDATVTEMTSKGASPGITCAGNPCYYALGWFVRPTASGLSWSHGGALPGTTAHLWRTSNNISWVVLFNSRSGIAGYDAKIETLMTNLIAGVTSFPSHDLFPSFR